MKYLFFVFTILFCLACKTQQKEDIQEPQKISLTDQSFEIVVRKGELNQATGMENQDLYISSPVFEQDVFLASEPGMTELREEQWEAYKIPTDNVFVVDCYYAGGGNVYYGIIEEDKLAVYKYLVEEPHPELEVENTYEYDLHKTITVFDDGSTEVN